MKEIVLLFTVSLSRVCSANTETDKSEPNKKGAYYSGKTDKSSVCGIDESADTSGYKDFRKTKNQFIDSDMQGVLSVSQKKGSAILYFGYPSCLWCVEALSTMNEATKVDKQHILHIRTGDDKKELLYMPRQKLEMISYTKQFMKEDDQGEYQLCMPLAVVVKDGKTVPEHIGTVDSHDVYERKMMEREMQELKKVYEDMSSAVTKQEDFMSNQVKWLALLTFFPALGLVLLFAFHSSGSQAGTVLLPMCVPVLLCGPMYSPTYGALVGMLTPLLSSALTGMPSFMPTGVAICLELSTYSFLSGWTTKRLLLYPSLVITMLVGRAVSGFINLMLLSTAHKAYITRIFLIAALVTAIPDIVLQLVMMPFLASAVKKLEVKVAEG